MGHRPRLQRNITSHSWPTYPTSTPKTSASPELLRRLDIPAGEEGDPGEPHILVVDERLHRHQVRLAAVVDEATDVAVAPGVQAERVAVPVVQVEEVGVVLALVRGGVGYDLTDVPGVGGGEGRG